MHTRGFFLLRTSKRINTRSFRCFCSSHRTGKKMRCGKSMSLTRDCQAGRADRSISLHLKSLILLKSVQLKRALASAGRIVFRIFRIACADEMSITLEREPKRKHPISRGLQEECASVRRRRCPIVCHNKAEKHTLSERSQRMLIVASRRERKHDGDENAFPDEDLFVRPLGISAHRKFIDIFTV